MVSEHKTENITIRIADSRQILEFQRLLFSIYCIKLNWHHPASFPGGIFTDEYDDVSVFLTVYNKEKLISGVRLVPFSEKGFPHERIFLPIFSNVENTGIDSEIKNILKNADLGKIMEVTRFIGDTSVRRTHTYDLMKAMYWFGLLNGIKTYLMVVDMQTFLFCRKLGFSIIPIGIPIFCEGSWTFPAVMTVADMIPSDDKVRPYFLDRSNLVGEWQK